MEWHCSCTLGTYPSANPRYLSANPSCCSNSKTICSIFFKFTVPSCPVANSMHVKRQHYICIISDTFPLRFCPKSANFWEWGHLNGLISIIMQCTSMLFQIKIAKMQAFPQLVTFLSCNKWFRSFSNFKSDTKVKIQGVVVSTPRARVSQTESCLEVRPHLLNHPWGRWA